MLTRSTLRELLHTGAYTLRQGGEPRWPNLRRNFSPLLGVIAGGRVVSSATEQLWSSPISQSQVNDNDYVAVSGSSKVSQGVHNTDTLSALITKIEVKMQEIQASGNRSVNIDIRTAVNGGGSSYGTGSGTLISNTTMWVPFVVSATIPASTNFFFDVWMVDSVSERLRMGSADPYEGTSYMRYVAGTGNNYYDLCFKIYITR